jgi:hypothetical protein
MAGDLPASFRASWRVELGHLRRSWVFLALALLQGLSFLVLVSLFGLTGSRAPTALVDSDQTAISRQFVDDLRDVSSARGLFRISGRCRLRTDGPAQCTASGGDDYGAYYGVKTTAGDAAYFSLGIEGYKGPGTYRTADVLFFVLYGLYLAQWQAPRSVVTITANSLVLPRTLLSAAPGTGATMTVTVRGTLPCRRA